MSFEEVFPLRFFLNLGRDAGRRGEVEWQLMEAGVEAERFPAIDGRRVKNLRGFPDGKARARAVTQQLALRKARKRGASAVLLLEDDVVFHPNFHALFEELDLPEDWGLLFLGGEHLEGPEVVGRGIVQVREIRGTHAVAVRASCFREVSKALRKGASLGSLAKKELTPCYAAFPNLVWQGVKESDYEGAKNCRYTKTGSVKEDLAGQRALLREMVTGEKEERAPKLGLLFLTRDDVNQPEVWREWTGQRGGLKSALRSEEASAGEEVRVFCHAKNELPEGAFLKGHEVSAHHETAWGEVSLVKATRALLEDALADETLTHFMLLSEACVPIRPLSEVLRRLQWDSRPQMRPRAFEAAPKHFRGRMAKAPEIPKSCSRFSSQWWLFDRTAAMMVMRNDYSDLFAEVFAADETYFATILKMAGYPLEDFILNEEVTWTQWSKGAGSPQSHETIGRKHVQEMVSSKALFARKFPANSDFAIYGLYLQEGC